MLVIYLSTSVTITFYTSTLIGIDPSCWGMPTVKVFIIWLFKLNQSFHPISTYHDIVCVTQQICVHNLHALYVPIGHMRCVIIAFCIIFD